MTSGTHQSIDTVYNADSIEWCPLAGFQDLMLCGTYQLEEGNQNQDADEKSGQQVRMGRLYLYQLDNQTAIPQLKECTSVDMAGILDIKWSYQPMDIWPCFAVVTSVGQLKVFVVKENNMVTMVTEEDLGLDCLGLSLEWDNMLTTRKQPRIASSDSHGRLHIHQFCEGCLKELLSWKAHDFEAWVTAFDQWNVNMVFSGGDDSKLKAWDFRMGSQQPVLTSKRHTMGVCSIQSNPVKEFQLATGSYDEHLLLWDSRHMKQPVSELAVGGGLWRIKWEPGWAQYILTASMYNGFHVVDISKPDLEVVCHYKEHNSIAYGADWCRLKANKSLTLDCKTFTVATCSFYDHLLKLWTFEDNKKH